MVHELLFEAATPERGLDKKKHMEVERLGSRSDGPIIFG